LFVSDDRQPSLGWQAGDRRPKAGDESSYQSELVARFSDSHEQDELDREIEYAFDTDGLPRRSA
jgi:hypothetical protein